MRQIRMAFTSMLAFAIGCTNVTDITEPTSVSAKNQRSELLPSESFTVKLPNAPSWQKLLEGPLQGAENTYVIAVADEQRTMQLSVVVLPMLPKIPTLDTMKPGWERGFLENANRKKSGENIRLSGRDAYKLTAAIDTEDGDTFDVVGILVVANGWNYTIGVTAPKDSASNSPEIDAFLDSFHIVDPGDKE